MPGALLAVAVLAVSPQLGRLSSADLDELSGLAVSRADPTVLWGHNDSGAQPFLHRIGVDGADLGKVFVHGAGAIDWEDIAAFNDVSGPALLIADTGDNFGRSPTVTLYAVRDPGHSGTEATLLWTLTFRYPNGPRDCEAVAVDDVAGEILLVSKREETPHLYALTLPKAPPKGVQEARDLGPVPGLKRPSLREKASAPVASHYFAMPTALDISGDRRTAVLMTPSHAYLYRREAAQAWSTVLTGGPAAVVPLPKFRQIESGALSADGRTLYVGSEGRPAPYARIGLPATFSAGRASPLP